MDMSSSQFAIPAAAIAPAPPVCCLALQVSVMTNGSVEGVAKPALTAGGAIQLLKGPLLDINMAQAWKPFAASYGYAVKQLGVPEDKVLMVASHPWDIAGAMQVRAGQEKPTS